MGKQKQNIAVLICAVLVIALFLPITHVFAQSKDDSSGQFSIQVTPSPLVFSAKPGTTTSTELKIRNGGSKPERLKIEPRSFKVGGANGEIQLEDSQPTEVTDWISFGQQIFTVAPGEWYTQKIYFSPPASAGFSYAFALHIGRVQETGVEGADRTLKGSVAVFTLVNIDRPGATRKLEISEFGTSKNVYEYLPITFNLSLKSAGNTIMQPYGNIFIQRNGNDSQPIATLPVNEKRGYILPGTTRNIEVSWNDGLPAYTTTTGANPKTSLTWDWSNIDKVRFGRYTAKLVAVYNDGGRDVPIQAQVQFWVLPWKFIIAGIIVILVFMFGLWTMISKMFKGVRHKAETHRTNKAAKSTKETHKKSE